MVKGAPEKLHGRTHSGKGYPAKLGVVAPTVVKMGVIKSPLSKLGKKSSTKMC